MSRFRKGPRPDGEIRRSQLLTLAGPGALIDLVEFAVVLGGLESWSYELPSEGYIEETRLEDKALKLLRDTGTWKHHNVRLRRPPDCTEEPSRKRGIAVSRFPSWYLCQSDACRSLVHWKGLEPKTNRHVCSERQTKSFPVVPIRFVLSCPRGHLLDVPWRRFIHFGEREEGVEEKHFYCHRQSGSGKRGDLLGDDWNADLFMRGVGTSGDMTDYVVGCRRCGKTRGLQDLARKEVHGTCGGWRPWLGPEANQECNEKARLLIRTATNAYFPQYVSVLAIPDSSKKLREAVGSNFGSLKKIKTIADLSQLKHFLEPLQLALEPFDDDDVLAEIGRRQAGLPVPTPPVREAEWLEFIKAPVEIPGELPDKDVDWFPRRYDGTVLPDFIDRIVLVHALREVRAQVGFTRLESISGDAEGEYALDGKRTAQLSLDENWIPAVEIRGEGVFIAFNEKKLRDWESRTAVQNRERQFRRALLVENQDRKDQVPFTSARLIMLHSLAHMLITAISLECGYAASSIRERIYCYRDDSHDDPEEQLRNSRAGILLYTGTPGSEGTLGGLVEIGRHLMTHLRRAGEMSLLCSNDPICAQHRPDGPEEGRAREGAACHACLLIAEPSCERMNRDLDRTLVVPTVEEADAAFLGPWLVTEPSR